MKKEVLPTKELSQRSSCSLREEKNSAVDSQRKRRMVRKR